MTAADQLVVATPNRVFARNTGGNTTYATSLYAALADLGVRHELLSPPARIKSSALAVAWEAQRAAVAAASSGAHVIHFPADTGALTGSQRLGVVTTVHGVADRYGAGVRRAPSARLWRARVSAAIRASDAVVTVSHSSAYDIAEVFGVAPERIAVAHHGIDHSVFRRLDPPEIERRLQRVSGLPGSFALFVGNIEPRKNVASAIEAFSRSELRALGLPLLVVGRPAWQSKHILQRASDLPNNLYLGPLPRDVIVALMNRATVFVFPTRYEGFGFPVLEAMACGCPVVTTRVGAVPEIAGEAAHFVEPRAESIADGVLKVASDSTLATRLRDEGVRRAAGYTWHASARLHAAVFRDAAAAKGLV